MDLTRVRQHLLPNYEGEPKLHEFLARLSAAGLQTLAVVEIAAAALLHLSRVAAGGARWGETLAMLGVGLVTLGLAKLGGDRYARAFAAGSVWLASALL